MRNVWIPVINMGSKYHEKFKRDTWVWASQVAINESNDAGLLGGLTFSDKFRIRATGINPAVFKITFSQSFWF